MTREEKQKAIDALKISAPLIVVTQEEFEDYIHTLNQVMDWLEQEPRWIPTSERLPEEYTYTLWCATSGEVRSDYFNGKYWQDAKRYCYEVVAWMPLPKAYREVEE